MMRKFNSKFIPVPEISKKLEDVLKQTRTDVEIGAGQGLHAIQYCRLNPKRTLLAIERTKDKFARLAGRTAAHPELNNLFAIHGDAVAWMAHHLRSLQVERLFILYPNPYPKSKQSNLRWHNQPFFELLIDRLAPMGELILATNLQWYAHEALEKITGHWQLKLKSHEVYKNPDSKFVGRTHFERKYLERGETCHNLIFVKSTIALGN